MTRQHRNQAAYPALWRAIDGAIRDAVAAHDDIRISDRRRASIVKRAVGQVLALHGVGAGQPAETGGGHRGIPAIGAHCEGTEGAVTTSRPQRRKGRKQRPKGMFPWHGVDLAGRRALHAFIAAERSRFVAFHRGRDGLVFVELRR